MCISPRKTNSYLQEACLPLAHASCTLDLMFLMLIAMNDRLIIE